MIDPLADPRSALLLAADPDAAAELAAQFAVAADGCATTAVGLRAARHQGAWSGRAADAYRVTVGRLPARLSRLQAAFGDAAAALRAYEPELAECQVAYRTLAAELAEAEQLLARARFSEAAPGDLLRPGRAEAARAALDALRVQAFLVLDAFSLAEQGCRGAIAALGESLPIAEGAG